MKKNAMTLITLLASFVLVACAKDKPKEDKAPTIESKAPSAPTSMAAPAAPNLPAAPFSMAAPSKASKTAPTAPAAAMTAPPSMGANPKAPTLKPTVVSIDPRGPMLTLMERKCTRLGSYKNRVKHLNFMKEVVCYNPNNGETRRVCWPSFPLTGRLTPSIVESPQVKKVDVTPFFHAEMKFGKNNVVTKDLVCHEVPVRMICVSEALMKQQASCGSSCKKRARKRRVRRARRHRVRDSDRDSDDSGSSGSSNGGPTAYDLEQDKKIAANTTRSKDNSRRLTEAEQTLKDHKKRWERRDNWAASAQTLLNSLKKK